MPASATLKHFSFWALVRLRLPRTRCGRAREAFMHIQPAS